MSSEDGSRTNRIIYPKSLDNSDSMNVLTHAVLDDILYNIIHDIVLKTHRDEKIQRANTAAIVVEQRAAKQIRERSPSSSPSKSPKLENKVQTSAAIYEDGKVLLVGNPLKTTTEIRCSKCGLPKLLHPTDGNGSRTPPENVEYCSRHPYISKYGHDIYGHPFPTDDAKPRKTAASKVHPSSQVSEVLSIDSAAESTPPPNKAKPQSSTFPNIKCSKCSRYMEVRRFRNHLKGCMGISSRASGRAANRKVTNGGMGPSSQNGSTSPGSRRGTPALGSKNKHSPTKRDKDDFDEDEDESEEEKTPKKKKKRVLKTKNLQKKWKSGKITIGGQTLQKSKLEFEVDDAMEPWTAGSTGGTQESFSQAIEDAWEPDM